MYVGAAGCYLEDAHGNRLFDANAGLWCVNIGYGRERWWKPSGNRPDG